MRHSIASYVTVTLVAPALGSALMFADTETTGMTEYKGRTVREWIARTLDKDVAVRVEALSVLQDVRSNCDVRALPIAILEQGLKHKDPEVRANAAEALYMFGIGPKAEAAVLRLIKACGENDVKTRYQAACELGTQGFAARTALPVLTKMLQDSEPIVRHRVARTLGGMGPEGKAAVPLLIEMLKEKPDVMHYNYVDAAAALGSIGPEAQVAVPELLKLLGDEFHWVRASAAIALGRIGVNAKQAMPELRKALHDGDATVRAHVTLTIWRIDRKAKDAIPGLVEALRAYERPGAAQVDSWTIRWVVNVLGEMGPEASEAVSALLPVLKDKECGLVAAHALKRIDPNAAIRAGIR